MIPMCLHAAGGLKGLLKMHVLKKVKVVLTNITSDSQSVQDSLRCNSVHKFI